MVMTSVGIDENIILHHIGEMNFHRGKNEHGNKESASKNRPKKQIDTKESQFQLIFEFSLNLSCSITEFYYRIF